MWTNDCEELGLNLLRSNRLKRWLTGNWLNCYEWYLRVECLVHQLDETGKSVDRLSCTERAESTSVFFACQQNISFCRNRFGKTIPLFVEVEKALSRLANEDFGTNLSQTLIRLCNQWALKEAFEFLALLDATIGQWMRISRKLSTAKYLSDGGSLKRRRRN